MYATFVKATSSGTLRNEKVHLTWTAPIVTNIDGPAYKLISFGYFAMIVTDDKPHSVTGDYTLVNEDGELLHDGGIFNTVAESNRMVDFLKVGAGFVLGRLTDRD